MTQEYEPLKKTMEVPCSQRDAFIVFIDEMQTWWPLERFSASAKLGKAAKSLRVQPWAGGKILEESEDGAEHLWGTIHAYDRFDRVTMDFHIGLPPETASFVEVRFISLGEEQTRVELTQTGWERFGEFAEAMYNGYPKGWGAALDAFVTTCATLGGGR